MPNPFEDDAATYHVLRNAEHQYSLWPNSIDVPEGWDVVLADQERRTCLDFIERHWTDMRPRSLAVAMDGDGL